MAKFILLILLFSFSKLRANDTCKLNLKASFSTSDVCENQNIILLNKSTSNYQNVKYHWDFGDGTFSIENNPINKKYLTFGGDYTFIIKLIANANNGCIDTFNGIITIIGEPKIKIERKYDFSNPNINLFELKSLNNKLFKNIKWILPNNDEVLKDTVMIANGIKIVKNRIIAIATNYQNCVSKDSTLFQPTGSVHSLQQNPNILLRNPSSKNLVLVNKAQNTSYIIFSELGISVSEGIFIEGINEINLLDSGIYFLKTINNNNLYFFQKIVVN